MITLTAQADYGHTGQFIARITGRHAKFTFNREFIGRKGGKRNETTTADIDEVGLYEVCDIDRKYGKESSFVLILEVDDNLMTFNCSKESAMNIAKELDKGRNISSIVVGYAADNEASKLQKQCEYLKNMVVNVGDFDYENRLKKEVVLECQVSGFMTGEKTTLEQLQPYLKDEYENIERLINQLKERKRFPKKQFFIMTEKQMEKMKNSSVVDQCWEIFQTVPETERKKVLAELRKRLSAD